LGLLPLLFQSQLEVKDIFFTGPIREKVFLTTKVAENNLGENP